MTIMIIITTASATLKHLHAKHLKTTQIPVLSMIWNNGTIESIRVTRNGMTHGDVAPICSE